MDIIPFTAAPPDYNEHRKGANFADVQTKRPQQAVYFSPTTDNIILACGMPQCGLLPNIVGCYVASRVNNKGGHADGELPQTSTKYQERTVYVRIYFLQSFTEKSETFLLLLPSWCCRRIGNR